MDKFCLATSLLNLIERYEAWNLVKAFAGMAIALILFAILIYRELSHHQHIQTLLAETQSTRAVFDADRKQVEKKLPESEACLQTLIDNIPYRRILETATEGIWALDRENQTTFVNQQMAKMLGYSVDEMLGQSIFAFMDETGQEIALRYLERRRQGIQEQHDFKFGCQNGTNLWAIVSATPLFDDEQNYIGALGMVTDVTDRRRIEESLRQREEQLQLALTASSMGIWDWDLLSNCIIWSEGHERLFGIAPGSFDGTYAAFEACVHPDDRAAIVQVINRARQLQQDFQHEFRVVWSDDSVHWIEGKGRFFYNTVGEAVRSLGIVADISDRKATEFALRQSEATNRALISAVPDLLIWINHDGIYLDALSSSKNIKLNKPLPELIRSNIHDVLPPEQAQERMRYVQQALQNNELQVYESQLEIEGEIRDEEARIVVCGEQQVLCIVRDITERKQAEESLRSRNQELLTLHRISEISLKSQSSKVIFQGIVEEISIATGFPIVAIELYDRVRQVMVFEGMKGIVLEDKILEVPVEQSLSGKVAQTGQAIAKNYTPIECKQCATNQDLSQLNIKTFVCVPMTVNQDTVGVLSLAHPDTIQIDDNTLRWIESLANYIALITHRNQLEASLQKANIDLGIQVAERTSELIAANQSLQQQRDQWQALFEHALDAIVISDDDGRYVDANPAACQLFGISKEDLLRSSIAYFAAPEMDTAQVWQQFLQRGKMLGEFCLHCTDSTTRETEFNAIANFLPGRHLSVLRDITERKRAEAALRESEERFRLVFDNAPIGIAVARITDHQFFMVNQAFCQLLGYTEAELLTNSCISISHPEDREKDRPFIMQMIAREINSYQFEKRYLKKNQQTVWANLTTTAVRDQNGDVLYLVGMVQDITERRQAQLALQEAHGKLTRWVNDLEQRHQEITLLNEMSDLMQACLTLDEAYIVIAQFMPQLFPDCSGAVYTIGTSKSLLESVTTWGEAIASQPLFTPNDCFALRRGQPHSVEDTHTSLCCKHLLKPLPTSYLCVPMAAQGETSGVLHLSLFAQLLTHAKQQLATTVARQIALAIANLKLYITLQNQSIRDSLTGLFNRRYLNEFLERELYRAERNQHFLSILLLDVDHFKQFNDTFGHDAGDAVLRCLSQFLQVSVRNSDIACRYGGEEMVLILPDTSLEEAGRRAEQLRLGVKHLNVEHLQALGSITVSIGVACFPDHGLSSEVLLQTADLALYQAKATGRDRVVMATNSVSSS